MSEPGGTLVDSSVLLDVFTEDSVWASWSGEALTAAADAGPVIVNPVVYAEVSVRFSAIEELDDALPASDFVRAPLPWAAAFLAAKAHQRYRQRGGNRATTLPDFFIGAHAAVAGLTLLTRDPRRVAEAFPRLRIVAPA